MTSSSKSKTLRVERLENRELMASYVGIVEAAEIEDMNLLSHKMAGKDGANWAKPMRMEVNAESDRPSVSPHMMPREMKGYAASNAMMERNNFGPGRMIPLPVVVHVSVVVVVRENNSDNGGRSKGLATANTSRSSDWNWSNAAEESVAVVGEGEGTDRFTDFPIKGSDNSSPPTNRETPQPNVRRPGIIFGGDTSSNVTADKVEPESEGDSNVDLNLTHETVVEARSGRQIREDEYFTQLGGAIEAENQETTLEDAYLNLFVFSGDRSTDFQFEDRLRSRQGRNVEMTWDYLVATTYGEETSSEEATPAKHNSLFDVYDPARSATTNVETLRYDKTKFLKDVTEQGNVGEDEELTFTDSRYWALGLVIASVWLGMQQRKSRSSKWLMGLRMFARVPKYFKKDSDRR